MNKSRRHKRDPSRGSFLLRGGKEKKLFPHNVEINLTVKLGRELGSVQSWISGWPDGIGFSALCQLTEPLAVGRLPSRFSARTSLLPVTCIALALKCLHGVAYQLCCNWLLLPSTINVPTAAVQGEEWRVLTRPQFHVCKVLFWLLGLMWCSASQNNFLLSTPF